MEAYANIESPAVRRPTVARPSPLRPLGAELPSRQRAKRTNDPLANINTNTASGRRVADLVRAFLRALDNPSGIEQQAAVIAAAELQVLAEEARTAALKEPGQVDLDQVIRMQGAADRAVRRLGVMTTKAAVHVETFAELAARAQAEADVRRAEELAADAEEPSEAAAAAVGASDDTAVVQAANTEARVSSAALTGE